MDGVIKALNNRGLTLEQAEMTVHALLNMSQVLSTLSC